MQENGHKTLCEFIEGAPLDHHTLSEGKPNKRILSDRFRWIEAGPALVTARMNSSVNWLSVTICDQNRKSDLRRRFLTNLPITAENFVEIAACAQVLWKSENETFNVLKSNGYNLTHNFGRCNKCLARMFATMNVLAFAFHTACDWLETLWQQARQALGTRKNFFQFQDSLLICSYFVFASWKHLIETLITQAKQSHPHRTAGIHTQASPSIDRSRQDNRDLLRLPFQVLGFPAPDCGCQKTAISSTRCLPTIVQ